MSGAASVEAYRGLVEVSHLIQSIEKRDVLLKSVLNVARRVMRAEAASIFLFGGGELRLAMALNGDNPVPAQGWAVPRGCGIAGWVFEHGQPLFVSDAYAEPRFDQSADRASGFVTRSLLAAPLRGGKDPIGVLQVLNPVGRPRFDEGEQEVFLAYADLTSTALAKLESLELQRERERLLRDMEIAADIQNEFLGEAAPKRVGGCTFAVRSRSAARVGGDFHGIFPRPGGAVDFFVGDVSGKGIPASLMMARFLSAMPFVLEAAAGPPAALEALNRRFCPAMVRGMFVTLCIGRADTRSQSMAIASAGHPPPWILPASGSPQPLPVQPSLPLGIVSDAAFNGIEIPFRPGDGFFLCTDGLLESRGTGGQRDFGDQLAGIFPGGAPDPEEVAAAVERAEFRHRNGSEPSDDMTILTGAYR
jgi:sigma-B regulation protein RsbU (phosphoserine phosphatase)